MTITFQQVGFEWPNGKTIFQNLNFSLSAQIYGVVGPNGVGKTTLARLVAARDKPSSGKIIRDDSVVYYFEQDELPPDLSIAEYLEGTSVYEDSKLLAFLGDIPFEKACLLLSGGEWTKVRLAKAMGSGAQFIILDEPTNHLDAQGKESILRMMNIYRGGLLIISHDRELLENVHQIIELSSVGVSFFSGGWSHYDEWRINERENLKKNLETAKRDRDSEKKERQEKLKAQEKRQKAGQKAAAKGGAPKILLGRRKRAAEQTLGKIDKESAERLDESVKLAFDAYQKLKVDEVMFAYLPELYFPKGKMVAEARDFNFSYSNTDKKTWKRDLNFSFIGPHRVAITGANGSGKSTLLKLLLGEKMVGSSVGELIQGQLNIGFLDQQYTLLNFELSLMENISSVSSLSDTELRNHLAMFLFQGDKVYQKIETLSGGEKMRAALALLLLRDPISNVLVMDEPTNNLDLVNIEFLENFLNEYKGALILVSHDKIFLDHITLDQVIDLG